MRIVVIGTGTEVGKTHVTECLLVHARALGVRAAAYKPIATGVVDRCEDAERHAAASATSYVQPSFAYRRPVSPHLAAREEGRPIDLDVIRRQASELEADVDVLIIEGAGGLFTPLADTFTNVELVRAVLPGVVILVGPDRLGVLHDVGATRAAAAAREVPIRAVVLSSPAQPDDSTSSNAIELERLGLGPVVGVLPRARADAAESQLVARKLWSLLDF